MFGSLVVHSSTYLLITTGLERFSGWKRPASSVAMRRLKLGKWPLYERTAFKAHIRSGDRVLIYLGGSRSPTGVVYGKATVGRNALWTKSGPYQEYADTICERPWSVLDLFNSEVFDAPVDFRSLLPHLDCRPKNLRKWGVVVLGGLKSITEHDYEKIISQSR